jgi:hypothetical protein
MKRQSSYLILWLCKESRFIPFSLAAFGLTLDTGATPINLFIYIVKSPI